MEKHIGHRDWKSPWPEAARLIARDFQRRNQTGRDTLYYLAFTLRNTAAPVASTEGWQPWRPGLPEELAAQGRPVFVDYTAAWCVTCQYNKQTTLSNPAVLQDLAAKRVALLRADWTRRDPRITDALRALGRSGVPVYAVYAPGRAPVVLSEVISAADVRAALAGL